MKRRRGGRQRPSDPQAITLARIAAKAREALAASKSARNPSTWGISADLEGLMTSDEDVTVVRDPHQHRRIVHAKRATVFELISLTDDQVRASERYWRDWCIRAGVMTEDARQVFLVVDHSPGLAPGQFLTQRMIDAGRRLDEAHKSIGRADARLLQALVEPPVMRGEFRVWRWLVQRETGETERHAQAAAVRRAVENLRLAYDDIDAERARRRKAAAAANDGPGEPAAGG